MARIYELQRRINDGSWTTYSNTSSLTELDTDSYDQGDIISYRIRQTDPYISDWSAIAFIEYQENPLQIPNFREFDFLLSVGRTDGSTWEDLTDYLTQASVQLGDVVQVGTGNMGGDSVVRTANLTLMQDFENSLYPLHRTSDWNTFGGSYSPLLFPMREVSLSIAIEEGDHSYSREFGTTQSIKETVGTGSGGSQVFNTYYKPVKPGSVKVYVNDVETSVFNFDYDLGQLTIATVGTITVSYTYYQPIFAGLLGDSIRLDDNEAKINLTARDYARRMQDAYIISSNEYGSEEGEAIQNVMQQIIDDHMDNPYTLRVEGTPTGEVKPYKVQYTSVFDATQQLAAKLGWYLGFMWHWDTMSWEYTLMEPPRNKGAEEADYYITSLDDIYNGSLDINDRDLRNKVTVEFRNYETEEPDSIMVEDTESIAEFNERQILISESDASQIDTVAEATTFANAALHDLKDLSSTNKLIMPLIPEIGLYSGLVINYPRQSNLNEFYAVESSRINIKINSDRSTLITELICSSTVKGAHSRWLEMETRPGVSGRLKPSDSYDAVSPDLPYNLTALFTGKDAIFKWDKPSDVDYAKSKVEIIIDSSVVRTDYVKETQYIYTYDMNLQDTVNDPSPVVTLRLTHVDTGGRESIPSSVQAVNSAPPAPVSLSLTSTFSQLQISVNRSYATDFSHLEYQISLSDTFSSPASYIDTNYTKNVPVLGEGTNYVRVRFFDVFGQNSTWNETSTTAIMLSAEDMQGSVFQITPSSIPEKTGLDVLWDMDETTGVTYASAPTIEFHYPMVWLFDMVRFYVDTSTTYTVEAYDNDSETWVTTIASGSSNANNWTVQRFDSSTMVATNRLRITFSAALSIYELKFWVVQLADEILAQVLTLTDNLTIQSENGNIILTSTGFQAFDDSSNKTVDIGNVSGDAWFKGTVEATEGFILPVRTSP